MKISVIIPVKNRASLLPITLNNILEQSLKPYEVIVVDDGSSDNIKDVISEFKSSVIFINSSGKGPGAARNTGLRIATGNAIQFFDSDDLMTKNKLQVQSNLLTSKNADFVYGPNVKAIYNNGKWQQSGVIMQYKPLPDEMLANLVLKGWCAITQTVLFSEALIREVGFWREDLMPHEDYEYWFRIGKLANHFYHENKSCVIYRQHEQQITDKATSDQERSLDGISAMQYISNGINFKPTLNSLLLFKGRYSNAKRNYINKFKKSNTIKMNISDYLYLPYFKILNKMGRLITNTEWQQMHGVLSPGENEFGYYINNL